MARSHTTQSLSLSLSLFLLFIFHSLFLSLSSLLLFFSYSIFLSITVSRYFSLSCSSIDLSFYYSSTAISVYSSVSCSSRILSFFLFLSLSLSILLSLIYLLSISFVPILCQLFGQRTTQHKVRSLPKQTFMSPTKYQRTVTAGGRITVRLVSNLTRQDLTKKKKICCKLYVVKQLNVNLQM